MAISIKILPDGLVVENEKLSSVERPNKGKSIVSFPDEFVIVDIETTGLDSRFDEIIEICALRVRNGTITDSFSSLVKPLSQIDEFIEQLTGITNDMLDEAPLIEDVFPNFLSFVGDQVIVGHNANFDINFLYDACFKYCNKPFENNFIDTMRIFRKLHPEIKHHRLPDMVKFYHVKDIPTHRAESDCIATFYCYKQLHKEIQTVYDSIDQFVALFKKKHYNLDLRTITTENSSFDTTNPFYGKHCVFTGALEKLTRKDAAQLVADLGGIPENGVTKHTNYLILGNNDYCASIKDGKSAKQKKAEEYILKGLDISIISENVFYEMLQNNSFSFEESIFDFIKSAVSSVVNVEFLRFEKKAAFHSVYYNSNLFCRINIKQNSQYLDFAARYRDLFDEKVISQVKSQPDFIRVHFDSMDEIEGMKDAFVEIAKSFPTQCTFDVCHRYEECSDAMKCLHPDQKHALECSYRRKLERGIVFYGKNRNIE